MEEAKLKELKRLGRIVDAYRDDLLAEVAVLAMDQLLKKWEHTDDYGEWCDELDKVVRVLQAFQEAVTIIPEAKKIRSEKPNREPRQSPGPTPPK